MEKIMEGITVEVIVKAWSRPLRYENAYFLPGRDGEVGVYEYTTARRLFHGATGEWRYVYVVEEQD